jgi:hypothetical protein
MIWLTLKKKSNAYIYGIILYIYIYNNFLIIWGIYTNICCEERVDALVCVMYQPITLHLTNITETL